MIEPTKENVRKASAVADFLNRIGYMPYLFFDTRGILRICRDETELCWWYKKCREFGKFRTESWDEYCKRLGIER